MQFLSPNLKLFPSVSIPFGIRLEIHDGTRWNSKFCAFEVKWFTKKKWVAEVLSYTSLNKLSLSFNKLRPL